MARIAVGGFQHETNTFAPHPRDLGRFRAGRRVARFCARTRAYRGGQGLQHPDRRCGRTAAGARPRDRAAVLVLGAALLLCRARRLRACCRRDARRSRRERRRFRRDRRHLSRSARRDGRRALRRRRGRTLAPHSRAGGRPDADRRQPRLPHQHDRGDGRACQRDGRLPHLSAYRHGGDRRPRRVAARPALARAPAALQGLPADRLPDPARLPVHRCRAGARRLCADRRDRARRLGGFPRRIA